MTEQKIAYVCKRCGGSNVLSDTISGWDIQSQRWIITGHYDSSDCIDCDQETALIEVELAKNAATA